MKKLLLLIVVFVASLSTSACASDTFASGSWRYKMTVVVETPEGDKAGSAVREVTVQRGIKLSPHSIPKIDLKGEAVVVDLGERGVLFAVLRGILTGPDYASDIPFRVFRGPPGLTPEGIEYYSNLKTDPKELTLEQYPLLVTFSDLNDPTTVKNVLEVESDKKSVPSYSVKSDNFEKYFGQGVRLKSITIEMTDEPVTLGNTIQFLPWLPEYYSKLLDGNKYMSLRKGTSFSNRLGAGSFSTKEVLHGR